MLRWRLLIGLASVFILLLAVGGYSIALISRLQADVDAMLRDNYESIRSAHNLRLAVLRMNAAFLRPRVADMRSVETSRLDNVHVPAIEQQLAKIRLLARTPEQRAAAQQLTAQLAAYLEHLRAVLALAETEQERYDELRADLIRRNLELTDTTESILRSHEEIMVAAKDRARRLAQDTLHFLVGAMVLALAVFAGTYFQVGRLLLTPIEKLTRSIEAVRSGRFEQTIAVESNDELGRLATAFNAMSAELAAYRRDTDETILRLNRSLRETIAAFPHPIFLLDEDFAIWVTNEAADTFLHRIDSPDHMPDALARRLEEVRRTHSDYLPEEPRDSILFRVDEREVHYLPRILRIFSPAGDFAGAAVILIDVTRFRWLDDMKTNLISTISHEIKTPLTSIRMVLHLLLERSSGDLNPTQGEMVQAACEDCERLLTTLNGLLELSRIETGHSQLELRPVAPRDLLEQTRRAHQTAADTRGISLSLEVDDDLPPVLADPARAVLALGNFVSNALRAAPAGSTVRLTAERTTDDRVRLSVIDAGSGIPEAYHARIFDKFFRAPGQSGEGAGLGLSIAREIILAHDGRIGMNSVPGIETRFHCDLPLAV